jgi:hypothetical protein
MANLLTPEYKKDLRKRDLLKVSYVYLIGLGVIFLLAAIFLVPSFLLAGSKRLTARENLELISASISSRESAEFGRLLEETNTKIGVLKENVEGLTGYSVIAEIVSAKPDSVSLNSFAFNLTSDSAEVQVDGFALSRDGLLAFVENLEGISGVGSVDLPISTLARDREIDFGLAVVFNRSEIGISTQ